MRPALDVPPPRRAREAFHPFAARFWLGDVDARIVALARWAFGAVVVFSLLDYGLPRFDFFSDGGVMPRATLLGGVARSNRICLLDAAGPPGIVLLFWLAAMAAATCFMIGYRTRLANALAFVLVAGFQERNTMAFDGSDALMRVLLFWFLFIPSGVCGSVDQVRKGGRPPATVPALAVRFAQLQFLWVYVVAVAHKLAGPTWRAGTALNFIFGMEHQYTRPLGPWLRQFPHVTQALTYGALGIEAVLPIAVFAPILQPHLRRVGLAAGVLLHLGILLTLKPGCFSYVMIACYPLLFDATLAARIYERVFGRREIDLSQPADPVPRLGKRGLALAALFVAVLWFPIPNRVLPALPRPLYRGIQMLSLWQSWEMFAPTPVHVDLVLRGPGQLADGTRVDVLRDGVGPLPPEEPRWLYSRWTKFVENYAYSRDQRMLLEFGRFLCRRWNDDRGRRAPLTSFDIERHERVVSAPGEPPRPWTHTVWWHHQCVDR
jgi:hypothetical protein